MAGVLFLCPQCNLGRPLAACAVEARARCLRCETTFRSDGYLFDRVSWARIDSPFSAAAVAAGMGCGLSDRKWRLLACASGRFAFDWCRNPWFRDALQTAERWADEGAVPRGVKLCRAQLDRVEVPDVLNALVRPDLWYQNADDLAFQQQQERERSSWIQLARRCVSENPQLQPDDLTENNRALAAEVLRDLVPNPFVPLAWNPDWFTSTVRGLAAHIYTAREFGTMPILADALQDAGCDDEQVLCHCRALTLHARGCWVLDAILGKT